MNQNKSDDASERPIDLIVRWLRWPESKLTGTVPWFVVAWRLPWMLLIYGGLALAWFGIAMANGYKQANRFWLQAT